MVLRRRQRKCQRAQEAYEILKGDINALLYMEKEGGGGTACSHWEEDIFKTSTSSELMTGWSEAGLYQPVSNVAVASLEDLGIGFVVDYTQSDPRPVPARRRTQANGPPGLGGQGPPGLGGDYPRMGNFQNQDLVRPF